MNKLFLLGDEAIGFGAVDSGISGIYSYPGTPSTEITETVIRLKKQMHLSIHTHWASNEKTSYEEALGMSYVGKRVMTCMKHVGLNVAADPFINSAISGCNGGLVLVVADDPAMHSSQNEQDSRFYGKFASVPVLEPCNQQEAYDMTRDAFILSEQFRIPVMIRITTRLAHSRSEVKRSSPDSQNDLSLPEDTKRFVLLPANARIRYKKLINLQNSLENSSVNSRYNVITYGNSNQTGIIASGIAWSYLMENLERDVPSPYGIFKIGQYPLPTKKIADFCSKHREIIILEEGYPFIEEILTTPVQTINIRGKLSGILPRTGELTPDVVGEVIGKHKKSGYDLGSPVINRPPSLCHGCGHAEVFEELREAINKFPETYVFSDIGCYTLGALPPYSAIHSCIDMGASITMAKGAADAGFHPAVAVIGDSTFTHSGITGLLDAINDNSPITVIISDNSTTAMTGGQESAGTGKIDKICLGLGLDPDHLIIIDPVRKDREKLIQLLQREFLYQGVSVIIAQKECIQVRTRKGRIKHKINETSHAI